MNPADRDEDIDYEPDVLKFKQIWDDFKHTHAPGDPSAKTTTKPNTRSKSKARDPPVSTQDPPAKGGQPKKQTVISEKNVTRNPKRDEGQVIEVVTNVIAPQHQAMKSVKNFVKREQYVPSFNHPTLKNDIEDLKKAVTDKDYELSLLRVSNTQKEDRIRVLEEDIYKRDQRIAQLESRERELLSRNSALTGNEKIFDYGQVEYENFRNDTRRLLKMLQTTQEYQQFAELGLHDNGVRFLNSVNTKVKTSLDTKERVKLHFCTCNKDFIPESGLWVPDKIYSYAKEFARQRSGELTSAELELMLYDLNKMWREREKTIINTLNSQRAKEVAKLKRKISNSVKE